MPTGGCRVQLAENAVLNAWGAELRVWLLTAEGLWCALPAANQWPGLVVEWQPARPLRRWVVSDAEAPARLRRSGAARPAGAAARTPAACA